MKEYIAAAVAAPLTAADPAWGSVPAAALDFRWADYFPSPFTTTAKLVHSPEGLTVRLETTEWPLRAMRTVCNEQICEDSCMEFFFIPNEVDAEYVNIEVNPFGVTHIGLGEGRHGRRLLDISEEGFSIETSIRFGKGWSATIFIPYTFIDRYFTAHTSVMRANFYKCGDLTVGKHFSVWSPIDLPKPDYHRPEFFGKITLA